ncbi:hypothetical protein [Actinokineospora auranticolor]|uniref:hypothetical protein n=1 Tax=Actinokineospora auranticolor TaxID=155976 RepID=UPI0015E2EE3E|nr:hypothetical protein [Actinokineospora auranticolor]
MKFFGALALLLGLTTSNLFWQWLPTVPPTATLWFAIALGAMTLGAGLIAIDSGAKPTLVLGLPILGLGLGAAATVLLADPTKERSLAFDRAALALALLPLGASIAFAGSTKHPRRGESALVAVTGAGFALAIVVVLLKFDLPPWLAFVLLALVAVCACAILSASATHLANRRPEVAHPSTTEAEATEEVQVPAVVDPGPPPVLGIGPLLVEMGRNADPVYRLLPRNR